MGVCRLLLRYGELYENRLQITMPKVVQKCDSLIVPLYRRIFIDAARAKQIFDHLFLKDSVFISEIRDAYSEQDWGISPDNPLVWRIYLTASNKYKDFKIQNARDKDVAEFYMENNFPRFIWVLEIGTISTFKQQKARVEVLLDATSSILVVIGVF